MEDTKVKELIKHGVLHDRYTSITRFSVLFDTTDSQCFLYAKNRLPKFLAGNPTYSVSFFIDDVVPGFWPKTSLRPFSEFYREKNTGVATSLKSLSQMAANPLVKDRVYYAYDLAELKMLQNNPLAKPLFNGVRIITRNAAYAKKIYEDYGLICSESHFMMEFDFNKIKDIKDIYG